MQSDREGPILLNGAREGAEDREHREQSCHDPDQQRQQHVHPVPPLISEVAVPTSVSCAAAVGGRPSAVLAGPAVLGVGHVIKGGVAELRAAADWPEEVEVEYAMKLSANSKAIIARVDEEANFRIALI